MSKLEDELWHGYYGPLVCKSHNYRGRRWNVH